MKIRKFLALFGVLLLIMAIIFALLIFAPAWGHLIIWLITLNQYWQFLACVVAIGVPGMFFLIFRKKRKKRN